MLQDHLNYFGFSRKKQEYGVAVLPVSCMFIGVYNFTIAFSNIPFLTLSSRSRRLSRYQMRFFCLSQHPDRLWEPSNCINQWISWPEREAYNQYVCFLKVNSLDTLCLSFHNVLLYLLLFQFLLKYIYI